MLIIKVIENFRATADLDEQLLNALGIFLLGRGHRQFTLYIYSGGGRCVKAGDSTRDARLYTNSS